MPPPHDVSGSIQLFEPCRLPHGCFLQWDACVPNTPEVINGAQNHLSGSTISIYERGVVRQQWVGVSAGRFSVIHLFALSRRMMTFGDGPQSHSATSKSQDIVRVAVG